MDRNGDLVDRRGRLAGARNEVAHRLFRQPEAPVRSSAMSGRPGVSEHAALRLPGLRRKQAGGSSQAQRLVGAFCGFIHDCNSHVIALRRDILAVDGTRWAWPW